jgi:acetylornithine deacetylase/succinyl-diaminopimelate desuccinylase-like protein
MAAIRAVREARGGRLGFNAKFILEMGEEIGSPDLGKLCDFNRDALKADLFMASDGPRLSADRPTLFLGCRGGIRIHLDVTLRDGGHHSGNWGGVLANPATILVNAISTLVDGHGRLQLDALKPPRLTNQIRSYLADVQVVPTEDEPALAENWGEEGLSAAERLYAWNTLEVLAMSSGNIEKPANAIPGHANAVLQLRFVVGTRIDGLIEAIRAHLAQKGFPIVEVRAAQSFAASRTDFDSPWITWAADSVRQTTGKVPAVLMQNSGLGTSLNALISLNVIYQQPCLLLISWRGFQGKDAPEHLVMGDSMTQILDAARIPHRTLSERSLIEDLKWTAQTFMKQRIPVALLLKKGIVKGNHP